MTKNDDKRSGVTVLSRRMFFNVLIGSATVVPLVEWIQHHKKCALNSGLNIEEEFQIEDLDGF